MIQQKKYSFGLPDNQIDNNQIRFALKNSKLEEFIKNLENGIETKIGEFGDRISGGQKTKNCNCKGTL